MSADGADRGAASAVEAANAALYDAFEAADIDLMGAVWLDSPHADEVVCVHPGWPPLRGRSAVLRSWAMIMANTPYIQFVLTDVDVSVEGDVAVVTCAENILTGMPESSGPMPGAGSEALAGGRVVATNVFRRTAAGWRLWVHHSSPVMAEEPNGEEAEDG
ncbi:MAG: nuclear transport factor 2 family protein [Actinomycetes bacterium]